MNSKQKKLILITLKLASSIALLLWVMRKTELSEIIRAIEGANIYLLGAAFLLYCASYYVRTYRWQILLRTKGINTSNAYLYQSYMVGIFFSNFLPSIVGGDGMRIYDIWRLEPNKSIAVTTVIVDRILGLITLIFFAFVALLIAPQTINSFNLSNYLWLMLGTIAILLIGRQVFFFACISRRLIILN